jgi:hypothetical protein
MKHNPMLRYLIPGTVGLVALAIIVVAVGRVFTGLRDPLDSMLPPARSAPADPDGFDLAPLEEPGQESPVTWPRVALGLALVALVGGGALIVARRRGKSITRRGQSYVEFLMVVPVLLLVLAALIAFGQMLYTKLGLEAASWAATRHAIATLDDERGVSQAHLAARYSLDGYGLNVDAAQVKVRHWGKWGRGTLVRSTVCYQLPDAPIPMGIFRSLTLCSDHRLPVYQWKSDWRDWDGD